MGLEQVGVGDAKLKIDVDEPVSKALGSIFKVEVTEETKKTNTGLDPNKPGLGTLLKQMSLFMGDIFGFIFNLFKKMTDQIKNSFILPILSGGLPFTLPALISSIINMVLKIVELIKEALSLVIDPIKWLLEKVASKLLKLNIPIPKFSIPLMGIAIAIPAIDMLSLSKLSPFSMKSVDKKKENTSTISKLKNTLSKTPLNKIRERKDLTDKIQTLERENNRLSKLDDNSMDGMMQDVLRMENEIAIIKDSEDQNTLNMLYSSLRALNVSLQMLKNMYMESVMHLFTLTFEVHNEIIMKKKEYLDDYLKGIIQGNITTDYVGSNTFIDNSIVDINTVISNTGVNFNNITGLNISSNVIKGNSNDLNSDKNYIVGVNEVKVGRLVKYKTSFLSYNFKNRVDIFTDKQTEVYKDRVVDKTYINNGKEQKMYKYVGNFKSLTKVPAFLLDELEKEELDIEEEIDKFNAKNGTEFKKKTQALDDKLNKPFIKVLKKEEYYYTPTFTNEEKEHMKSQGIEIPQEHVLVTQLEVSGYTATLLNMKFVLDKIVKDINDLENTITDIKKRIKEMGKDNNLKENANTTNDDGSTNKSSCCGDSSKKELTKPNQDKVDALNKQIKEKKDLILSMFPASVLSSLQLVKMLIGVLKFPIDIIIGLIGKLMCGIIEFVTSLPLLKFGKIIEFFTALVTLPANIPMLVMETLSGMLGPEALKMFSEPLENIVNNVPQLITGVLEKYTNGIFKKEIPF